MLALLPLRLAALARGQVRQSSSLWRKEMVRGDAEGRYRIGRRVRKPTMPVRLETVLGVSNFKHGVILPDGHVIPWYGKPGNELVEFWRQKVAEWRALLELRRRRGLPEVFSCPRCEGVLSRYARVDEFDELFAEDWYYCPTPSCAIDEARVRKTLTVAAVHVVSGIAEEDVWRKAKRRADIAAGIPVQMPNPPRKVVSKVSDLGSLQRSEVDAVAEAMRRLREQRARIKG